MQSKTVFSPRGRLAIVLGVTIVALPLELSIGSEQSASSDPAQKEEIEQMMKSATMARGEPDHDFATNSLRYLMTQSRDLNLSEDQSAKIKTIMNQYGNTRIEREQEFKRAETDVMKLIHDDKAKLTEIEGALRKSDQAHTELRLAGIKAMRAATAVLTPEQHETWRQSHASRPGEEKRRNGARSVDGESSRIAPH
jgi:Spy/CpxP family protein refolding chaperone